MVLKRPFDPDKVKSVVKGWNATEYYWRYREHQYLDLPDRLLIEELLDDGHSGGPLDYRFYCFHGHPEIVQVDNYSNGINSFYDTRWNRLNLKQPDSSS